MAWKVLVVLLVTSGCGGMSASASYLVHSKSILLKPNANSMNITITARSSYGTVGVTVPLNECFSSDENCWQSSDVQVQKKPDEHFHFSLRVGYCKMDCWNKGGNIKSNLEEIKVIPYGLLMYPNSQETVYSGVKIEDCTSSLNTNISPHIPSLCCTRSTDASPPHASPTGASPRPSSGLLQTPSHATNSRSIVTMLVVVEVVQVLGTCVMAIAVVVVIRKSSRRAAAIKSGSPEVLQGDSNVSHE